MTTVVAPVQLLGKPRQVNQRPRSFGIMRFVNILNALFFRIVQSNGEIVAFHQERVRVIEVVEKRIHHGARARRQMQRPQRQQVPPLSSVTGIAKDTGQVLHVDEGSEQLTQRDVLGKGGNNHGILEQPPNLSVRLIEECVHVIVIIATENDFIVIRFQFIVAGHQLQRSLLLLLTTMPRHDGVLVPDSLPGWFTHTSSIIEPFGHGIPKPMSFFFFLFQFRKKPPQNPPRFQPAFLFLHEQ
mmetsp:Transcript_9797/g.21195  ORF Transcript_9797/g.21195 Transcript_9797/m.21195 type:complete len:242 (-) Transcript_9797:362-1087(-)